MKNGYLSQYFEGVIAKRLSGVEVNSLKSNQHEFNGVASMKELFGTERQKFTTRFLFLDDENPPISEDGHMTWYDARANNPNRSEYRLFFSASVVRQSASAGDILFICLRPDKSVLVVIVPGMSTIGSQLAWLFGIRVTDSFCKQEFSNDNVRLEYASKCILNHIGIELDEQDTNYLEDMLIKFNGNFPGTREFSAYARDTLRDVNARDNPDEVLVQWLDREEVLFRTLEKHLIQKQLDKGFSDVDEFIAYSLSVQNRRKSRAGQSLENHFEVLLKERDIHHARTSVTENHSKPDFIFPGIKEYHDEGFPTSLLTMLGAKSTCKDRWRQVLAEADRIKGKHLLTLEAAISVHQTDEMASKNLQLVVPKSIHKTYTIQQQEWLMDVNSFIRLLEQKQLQM